MGKIYNFTNENTTSFESLYDFHNARVLTVLSSGDQYFSSALYGAKSIDVYDVNKDSWDYFVLKFYGFRELTYEEFYDYFCVKRMDDINCFGRLCRFLPRDVRDRLTCTYINYNGLSPMINCDSGTRYDARLIPYFDKENYYKLQELLRSMDLPTFYHENLVNLPEILLDKKYDIALTSNIFYSIYLHNEKEKIPDYKKLLERFDCPQIQAMYSWLLDSDMRDAFLCNGFRVDDVNPAPMYGFCEDSVISLIR